MGLQKVLRVQLGGGLIRNNVGALQCAYSLNFGACHAFMAEIKAVEFGLGLAKRMRISKLQVQMDNQAVVLALQGTETYGGVCTHIIRRCREMLGDPSWIVVVKHCYREGNRAADWLANQEVCQNNKTELIQVPPLNLGRFFLRML